MGLLAGNWAHVQARAAAAAERAGRAPTEVTLIAVSKTHPVERVNELAQAGVVHFGENRIEEAAPKMRRAMPNLTWHMIGQVQSRKAHAVSEAHFALVHSVASYKLAERLSRFAQAAQRVQPILLECNVSGEASKAGFPAWQTDQREALQTEFGAILALPGVQVQGLMTIAPIGPDPEAARPFFRCLRELQAWAGQQWPKATWRELSMGMTDDFEIAIAEGATLVRVGRAIFGERT